MADINITINGGTNTIVPNATHVTQNFYGTSLDEKTVEKLSLYINKENIPEFVSRLGGCETATEVAKVVVDTTLLDPSLTAEKIVKERFIKAILPHATKLTKGTSVDNVRQRINDAWAARPK